jgi:hypothetical protein
MFRILANVYDGFTSVNARPITAAGRAGCLSAMIMAESHGESAVVWVMRAVPRTSLPSWAARSPG